MLSRRDDFTCTSNLVRLLIVKYDNRNPFNKIDKNPCYSTKKSKSKATQPCKQRAESDKSEGYLVCINVYSLHILLFKVGPSVQRWWQNHKHMGLAAITCRHLG